MNLSVTGPSIFLGHLLMGRNFDMHPAVNMTWYESAFLAAALEDVAQKQFPGIRIRAMRDAEYACFVTWDDKYTEDQVKERAHLRREGVTGTASVADAACRLKNYA